MVIDKTKKTKRANYKKQHFYKNDELKLDLRDYGKSKRHGTRHKLY